MAATPGIVLVSDRSAKAGFYPVTAEDGTELATIDRRPGSRSFTVHSPDGTTLCSGVPRRLKRCYDVLDAAERAMITFRSPAVGLRHKTAKLADGSRLDLSVRLRTGTWTVAAGREPLLTIERANGRLHPDDVRVQVHDPGRQLPFVLGLVVGHLCDERRTTVWDMVPYT